MMSMNVWKRATLAIVRKPVRSGIIGLLMLMVFTSLGGAGRSLDGPAYHVRRHRRGHGHRVYRQRRRESH